MGCTPRFGRRADAAAQGIAAAILFIVAGGLSGCAAASQEPATESASGPAAVTQTYLPGLEADVRLPENPGSAAVPVLVLVPGGGWQTADRSGLSGLATQLANNGFMTVNATYRSGADGVTFPTPVDDVRCAIGFAVWQAQQADIDVGRVIVLGHSSAGQLAALAAFTAPSAAGTCPYDVPAVDGLVGLAGVYDTEPFEFALVDFFGAPRSEDPQIWAQGDPIALVEAGRAPHDLRVLLLHGDADESVPLEQSKDFAAALQGAGNDVELDIVPGATHETVYTAEVAGQRVSGWIQDLRDQETG